MKGEYISADSARIAPDLKKFIADLLHLFVFIISRVWVSRLLVRQGRKPASFNVADISRVTLMQKLLRVNSDRRIGSAGSSDQEKVCEG